MKSKTRRSGRRAEARLLGVCLVWVLAWGGGWAAETTNQPDILLFFTDDQRPSSLGAYGNPVVQTPALDRVADRGLIFSRAYMMGGMTGATCVPSRAMLHTGRHLFHLRNNGHTIRPDTPTLGETFRAAGYHTYFSGKRHAMDRQTLRRSFESGGVVMGFAGYFTDKRRMPMHDWDPDAAYLSGAGYVVTGPSGERLSMGEIKQRRLRPAQIEPGRYSSELYVDPAAAFIRAYRDPRPLFMVVSLSAPHDPHEAPESIRARYDPATVPVPPNLRPRHPFDNGDMEVRDEKLAPTPRDPAVIRARTADYLAAVDMIDRQYARLVQALDDAGRLDRTILIFMGDSGLAVGQHGLLGKQNLYDDAGIRVPWVMAGPGIPAGRTSPSLVSTIDLYPTLCELAGIPVPTSVDGRSLTHLFREPEALHRPFVYAGYRDIQRAVVGPRYKLIEYVAQSRPDAQPPHTVGTRRTQMFDLRDDPWETRDLASDPTFAGRVRALRDQLGSLRILYEDGTETGRREIPDMHEMYARFWQSYLEPQNPNTEPRTQP